MKELIAQYCKELGLGKNIVENYQRIQAETNEEFLLKLLKLEIENRRISRKNRYLKQANFEVMKSFEDYSFENVQIPQSITLEELREGRFLEKKENLILYGPVGTGKTHMATAIGIAACNREKKTRFYRTATLVNELVEAKNNGALKRFLKTLRKTDLLICDEWGLHTARPRRSTTLVSSDRRKIREEQRNNHNESRIQQMEWNILR